PDSSEGVTTMRGRRDVCLRTENQLINDVLTSTSTTCPAPETRLPGSPEEEPARVISDHDAAADAAAEIKAHVHDDEKRCPGSAQIPCPEHGAKTLTLGGASREPAVPLVLRRKRCQRFRNLGPEHSPGPARLSPHALRPHRGVRDMCAIFQPARARA